MLKVTRLYTKKEDASGTVNEQSFLLNPASIESIRPSTALKGQKATIRTTSGFEMPIAETVSQVLDVIDSPVADVTSAPKKVKKASGEMRNRW